MPVNNVKFGKQALTRLTHEMLTVMPGNAVMVRNAPSRHYTVTRRESRVTAKPLDIGPAIWHSYSQDAAENSYCGRFSDSSTAFSLTAGAPRPSDHNRVFKRGRTFVPPSCICGLADSGLEFGLGDSAATRVVKRLHLSLTAGNAKRELRPVNRPAASDGKVVKPVQDRCERRGPKLPVAPKN